MFIEVSYPISHGMPVYPGLPEVRLDDRERITNGDAWNGTVMTIYTHAGTHVDAPSHYRDGAMTLDKVPLERFLYDHPVLVPIEACPEYLITPEDIRRVPEAQEADLLLFDTGWYKLRSHDFTAYATDFPALSAESAAFIRAEMPQVKAVAIDTLSIENLKVGATNGYATHNTLLSGIQTPSAQSDTAAYSPVLIYEDYDPSQLEGKKLLRAFATPLRLTDREATPINLVVEVEG